LSIIGDTESRHAKYGISPPACASTKRMRGNRSIAPLNTRFTAARVVSNTYSIMKPGHGSSSVRLDGCSDGCTNTTAPRSLSASSTGSNQVSPRNFPP
jgi:hypothetical protein